MQGWIKLHRKSIDSVVFQNANLWQVWTYCLMRANHKEQKIFFNGEETTLHPGQFITGRYTGAEDCNMKPSTFKNQIMKLKKLQKLDTKSDNKKTVITLVNWGLYQFEGAEVDSKEDNKRTAKGHRQECKNVISKDIVQNKFEQATIFKLEEVKSKEELLEIEFNKFWKYYDKRTSSEKKCFAKWKRLSTADKNLIRKHLPKYIASTPDKKYRKNPLTYLNNESWNDEIISSTNTEDNKKKISPINKIGVQ